jgi:hypothetical protein
MQQSPIDLSGIGNAFVDAIRGAMPQLFGSAADAVGTLAETRGPTLATNAGAAVVGGGGSALAAVQNNPLNVLTSAPPELTYANPVVQQLQGVTVSVAFLGFALVICAAGFMVMSHSTMGGLNFGEAFGRIVVGAALLGGVTVGSTWLLMFCNALAGQLLLHAGDQPAGLLGVLADLQDGGAGLLLTLVAEVAGLAMYAMLWGRIVLLDVLLVLAPLAVLCWMLPQTRSWFSVWCRHFVGWALVGPVCVLVLVLGLAIGSELGHDDIGTRLAGLILSIAVFVIGTTRVPPMLVSGAAAAFSLPAVVVGSSSLTRGAAAAGSAISRAARRGR